jgi:hypothetical protein
MIKHLANPEYLHVLLNPLPIYGLAVALLGLLISLIRPTPNARVIALALVFVSSASAWPVYHYGEAASDRVEARADEAGGKWLDEHRSRAEHLIYIFYAVAVLSAVAIAAEFKLPRSAVPLAIATLILASANLAAGGYIAYAGGRIQHRELRFEAPPVSQPSHPD